MLGTERIQGHHTSALTDASRAANDVHVVILWRSPEVTVVAPTKRLITRAALKASKQAADGSTPGRNAQHDGVLR